MCKDGMFDNHIDNIEYTKNLFGEEISKSKIIDRLKFFPTTIWQPNWNNTKILKKEINDTCQTRKTLNSNRSDRRHGVNGKPSVFNPDLAIKILSVYCPKEANIYDPFAGGGTRGYIAKKMGNNYSGVELRIEEVNRIKNQMKLWNEHFNLKSGNSEDIHYDNKFNFSYTCPPYYDLEKYSDLDNDLSNAKTYADFLIMIKNVLKTTYDLLEDNSFCIWVVGNFRNKKGELVSFNADTIHIAKEQGFKLWDEIIWNGASNVALTRIGKFEKNKKAIRIHEYILVFKKCN